MRAQPIAGTSGGRGNASETFFFATLGIDRRPTGRKPGGPILRSPRSPPRSMRSTRSCRSTRSRLSGACMEAGLWLLWFSTRGRVGRISLRLAKFSFSEIPAGTGSIISFIVADLWYVHSRKPPHPGTVGLYYCRREILFTVTQEASPDNASFVLPPRVCQIVHIP